MQRHLFRVGLVLVLIAACSSGACDRSATPSAQLPPPVVTVSQPLTKEVVDYIEYTGTTRAIETVDVRARVKGFLQSMSFEPRAKVQKDHLLFVIDQS